VKKVAFHIESTRVGQTVDYERLILEVWTNGGVTPFDAVADATRLLTRHFEIIGGEQNIGEKLAHAMPEQNDAKETAMSELKLSTRVINALTMRGLTTLSDILAVAKEDFLEMKNLGKKSVEELEEALAKRGLRLLTKEEISQKAEQKNAA